MYKWEADPAFPQILLPQTLNELKKKICSDTKNCWATLISIRTEYFYFTKITNWTLDFWRITKKKSENTRSDPKITGI
jgi:hypothetical protein